MVRGVEREQGVVSDEEVRQLIAEGTPEELVRDKRVLVVTPDPTRTCPLPMMVRAIQETLGPAARRIDYMIALGSHHPLSETQIDALFGIDEEARRTGFAGSRFLNHEWHDPNTLVEIGTFSEDYIEEKTNGLFRESVRVDINRAVYDYDFLMVLGPVFPHEVVGFSGSNKYFFPGISGGAFLHFFHWLGAVITCRRTIGYKYTPMRNLVDEAARMIPLPRHYLAMVVRPDNRLAGFYVGTPEEAWSRAADLSARLHIRYMPRQYHTVLGVAPQMYDEIWVGGKVMYKLEPVVADGGTLIIYAPHIREVSSTWGAYLRQTGYHVRDYFLSDMAAFEGIPRAVLAHSTHVKGDGTYELGQEKPRINVVLATGISREETESINLGYLDPASVDLADYRNREEEGVLFVDHAGEVLHRPEWERGEIDYPPIT
ncbi:MAG: lactate racemase domain-containing protein [Spirochaetaceae bacterium]